MASLDLALIGNCNIAALINPATEIVWACLPRFDGDPAFCSLLTGERAADDAPGSFGWCRVDLVDAERNEQSYVDNTAIVTTRLYDRHGGAVEVTDFAPRFTRFGRVFNPMMMVRQVRRLSGNPRICLRVRPAGAYGAEKPMMTRGSHHIRYVMPEVVLRLSTDASITAIL